MNLLTHFKHARNAVTLPAGKIVFEQGERGTVMYVVMEGSVSVFVGDELVDIALPGSVIGEMALIDDAPRSATAVARTECKLVPIPQAQFDLLIAEAPAFARYVMASLAQRLRAMNTRLEERVETVGV